MALMCTMRDFQVLLWRFKEAEKAFSHLLQNLSLLLLKCTIFSPALLSAEGHWTKLPWQSIEGHFPLGCLKTAWPRFEENINPRHLHSFSSLRLSVALRIFSVLCCSELCSCFRAAVTFPFQSLFIIAIYPVSSQTFQLDFSPIFPPTTAGQQGDVPQCPAHDLRPDRVEIPNPLWDPAPGWAQGAEKESDCQNWLWQQVCEQHFASFSCLKADQPV